jgi:hypothetical protein
MVNPLYSITSLRLNQQLGAHSDSNCVPPSGKMIGLDWVSPNCKRVFISAVSSPPYFNIDCPQSGMLSQTYIKVTPPDGISEKGSFKSLFLVCYNPTFLLSALWLLVPSLNTLSRLYLLVATDRRVHHGDVIRPSRDFWSSIPLRNVDPYVSLTSQLGS